MKDNWREQMKILNDFFDDPDIQREAVFTAVSNYAFKLMYHRSAFARGSVTIEEVVDKFEADLRNGLRRS